MDVVEVERIGDDVPVPSAGRANVVQLVLPPGRGRAAELAGESAG